MGTGEGLDAIEVFDPARISGRILGMGDMLGLIEKAEAAYADDIAMEDAERMLKGQFTLEDFAKQLKQIKKMGPLSQVMGMLPGQLGQAAKQVDPREIDGQLKSVEAIIASMTPAERRDPRILYSSLSRIIA